MKLKALYLLSALLLGAYSSSAKVTLPAIMGDNMVLQQQSKVNLWGKPLHPSRLS